VVKPVLHVCNNSKNLGPGRAYTIMAQPRYFEKFDGECLICKPSGAEVPLMRRVVEARREGTVDQAVVAEYRAMYERRMEVSLSLLAPGMLRAFVNSPRGTVVTLVQSGDSLLCACSKAEADAGRCHRSWVSPFLARAGWAVVRDGTTLGTTSDSEPSTPMFPVYV
jgi:hypothetical protein